LPDQVISQGRAPKGEERQEGSRSLGDHRFNQLQPIRYGLLRKYSRLPSADSAY
jgi:hypothetical protein